MFLEGLAEFGPSPGAIERIDPGIRRTAVAESKRDDYQKARRPHEWHTRKCISLVYYYDC